MQAGWCAPARLCVPCTWNLLGHGPARLSVRPPLLCGREQGEGRISAALLYSR